MADNSLPTTPERDLDLVTYEQVKEIRVVDTSDNSKTLAIDNLTIAGTKVTVAVDGLSGTVDGAFGDVLAAISEKADTTQVEALDAEKVDKTQSVIAGAGMTGGGALAGGVTLNVVTADDSLVVAADNVKVNTVDALTSDSATRPLSAKQGKALNVAKVGLTGNETIAGVKTFSSSPIVPTPTTDYQSAPKTYVDTQDEALDAAKVNKTDIEQVRSQATNKVASSKLLDDELTKVTNTERPIADIFAHLLGRIETLEQIIAASVYKAIQVNELSVVNNIKLKGADLILFGTTAPVVTPDFVGQFFVNTTEGVTYQAKGIVNSGDWKQTSN